MKKELSFEEALSSLESQVAKLESGELSLDESLSAFEEAIKMVKQCNKRLDATEQRVKMLVEAADGSVSDVPFEVNDAT